MRGLECDNMGEKVDGRQLRHLRFADDIVLITSSINQAELMLAEFDETCKKIGLQPNLDKTVFMRNGWVFDAPLTLKGANISECSSYVYLSREINMMNDLQTGQKKKSGLGSIQEHRGCSEEDQEHPAPCSPITTTVLPALTNASETCVFRKQEENAISVIERGIERVMLGVTR
ncbi:hypothetical protein RB195_005130 [Necator americanus]|uniref:Reverse transcriptase domain-containing protein n=1 Tax=Necator americanus TaxID=51031 RepID=A0ABR1BQ64_NECAM